MPATPAWPPRSAPRLFVEQRLEESAQVTIEGNQAHYLNRVMRIREGETIILCDDQTGEWAVRIESVEKRTVLGIVSDKLRDREEVPDFWLCPALLKKDRFDAVLEKATELGVRQIKPILMRRCVADKLNADRARMIVTEAAEQCARTALPDVSGPIRLEKLLAEWPGDRVLFFADEMGGRPAAATFAKHTGPAAMLLGPEGGFDDTEREMLRSHPYVQPITLGPRILRGETAAIVSSALWMAVAGDW